MTQQNDPHNHPTRRASSRASYSPRAPYPSPRANSSRVSASQRMSVPHARDELEREREMYSAHDPNQNAPSPAQRYAQAQKKKQLTKGKTIGIVILKSLATPVNQKQLRALPT